MDENAYVYLVRESGTVGLGTTTDRIDIKPIPVLNESPDDIYSTEETEIRTRGCQRAISLAEDEILKLNQRIGVHKLDGDGIGALKHKLGLLRVVLPMPCLYQQPQH